jgi:GNAT superfamily N-acetyltransferase
MSRTAVAIRPVEATDLDPIVRIDEKLTGKIRQGYWRIRLDIAALRPPWMSLVAEMDGPSSALFGWVGESEFGTPVTAWVDLIGVDPPYRGRGVAQALVERFAQAGTELRGITKLATLIDLGQADIREFFTHLGFRHGPMIQLGSPCEVVRPGGPSSSPGK